jgi:5-formyltetrahydrofolate cyclo-ligase
MFPQLRALASAAISSASLAVGERLRALLDPTAGPTLVIYAATEWEIDIGPVAQWWQESGGTVAAPRSTGNAYELAVARPGEWTEGRFGIAEPAATAPPLPADARHTATWLVPAVAFAPNGTRLGRGGGFYDRLMAGCSGLKVGVAHDFQVLDGIPSAPHDIRMDLIVTNCKTVAIRPVNLTHKNEG